MHVDRLKRMVKLLRDDAAKPDGVKFDLAGWVSPVETPDDVMRGEFVLPTPAKRDDNASYFSELAPMPIPVSCDTYACAFGLAAISGEFAKEGLSYSMMTGSFANETGEVPAGTTGTILPAIKDDNGQLHTGFEAAAELFGITHNDTLYLFDPEHYDGTPREAEGELLVAKRIEDFISGDIDYNYHPDGKDEDEDEDENFED